jgi:Family of unknown function (DUF6527)
MKTLIHKFTEFIPDKIEEGIIYISIEYCTAIHKCCCGCGNEVVTPLSPTDWELSFNGEAISLSPSIGNWSFDCKSHYWVINNTIRWSRKWPKEMINANRENDQIKKSKYYKKKSK